MRARTVVTAGRRRPAGELWVPAIAAWVAARVVVGVAWVLVEVVRRSETPGTGPGRLAEGLLAWDGQWYLRIAEEGYRTGGEEARFFPLFPALGRAVGWVVGDAGLGLVVVADVAAVAALVLLGRLVLDATGDHQVAQRSMWALALWPASFVLVFAYAESLLLAASVGVALALRRQRWWLAAGAGVVAGLARPNALALEVLAVGYAVPGLRAAGPVERLGRLAAVVAPVAGFAAVLALAAVGPGDALAPVTEQSSLRGDLVDPVSRLVRGVGDLLGDERLGDGLHLPFAVGAIVLVALVLRHVGPVEALYTAVVVVVALSADNWNSLERYLLNAFPVFWALGVVTARREVERWVLALGAAGLLALTVLAWTGDYVP